MTQTASPAIILHDYWRSSSSYRVRIGLNVLGLVYGRHSVDLLNGAQRDADNLQINPQGLVPTLQIDGLYLTQSLAILEYLNETRGFGSSGLLPKDSAGRAKARAIAMAIAMEIQPICIPRVAGYAVAASQGAIVNAEWMQHFIATGLAHVEAMLADTPSEFCYGDTITLADICLVPQIYNARRWGVDLAATPRLAAIAARAEALPAFAAAHPDRFAPVA